MKKKFEIDNSIALKTDNYYVDLHNFYSLKNYVVEIPENNIILSWILNEKWADENTPYMLHLFFENVSFLKMSENFYSEHPVFLEEIGYKEPSDTDHDWLSYEDNSENHLFFRFRGDEYLRIFSERINIEIVEKE